MTCGDNRRSCGGLRAQRRRSGVAGGIRHRVRRDRGQVRAGGAALAGRSCVLGVSSEWTAGRVGSSRGGPGTPHYTRRNGCWARRSGTPTPCVTMCAGTWSTRSATAGGVDHRRHRRPQEGNSRCRHPTAVHRYRRPGRDAQVAVYLAYAARGGAALIDRDLSIECLGR
jgi:hypothetical protein